MTRLALALAVASAACGCGPDCPVERVSYGEVTAFIGRLNGGRGVPYRLPSEAEWEYACRAGGSLPFGHAERLDGTVATRVQPRIPAGERRGPIGAL
jgi:formylglycine-generating enzyme required for sulfatase activity